MHLAEIILKGLIKFGVWVTMSKNNSPLRKKLSPEAERALAEAKIRRAASEADAEKMAAEHGGPRGEEPTRFGDWERKGIAYDF